MAHLAERDWSGIEPIVAYKTIRDLARQGDFIYMEEFGPDGISMMFSFGGEFRVMGLKPHIIEILLKKQYPLQ